MTAFKLHHTHSLPLFFRGRALRLRVCCGEYLVLGRMPHELCETQMMCVAASREEQWTGESWPSLVMMQLLPPSLLPFLCLLLLSAAPELFVAGVC